MISGKQWGVTECLLSNHAVEFHRLEVLPAAKCSEHKHDHKFNGFYVEQGKIELTVWRKSGTVDKTTLKEGDFAVVAPGEFHQFRGIETAVVFEIYWLGPLSEDIDRRTVGSAHA